MYTYQISFARNMIIKGLVKQKMFLSPAWIATWALVKRWKELIVNDPRLFVLLLCCKKYVRATAHSFITVLIRSFVNTTEMQAKQNGLNECVPFLGQFNPTLSHFKGKRVIFGPRMMNGLPIVQIPRVYDKLRLSLQKVSKPQTPPFAEKWIICLVCWPFSQKL